MELLLMYLLGVVVGFLCGIWVSRDTISKATKMMRPRATLPIGFRNQETVAGLSVPEPIDREKQAIERLRWRLAIQKERKRRAQTKISL